MKKIYSFILSTLILLGVMTFSACGVNYDNLDMSFYSTEGVKLSAVQLLIKEDQEDTRIGIRFDGIDEKDIGEIEIKSIPNRLSTITHVGVEDGVYYFTIKPEYSEKGVIQVKHWSSGKVATIPLVIDKKSNVVEANGNRLIVNIPDVDTEELYQINYTDIIKLDNGATDDIAYKVDETYDGSKLKFYTTDENGDMVQVADPRTTPFTHIHVDRTMTDAEQITIFPVSSMMRHGIEPSDHENAKVTVVFLKILTEENVALYSFDKLKTADKYGAEYKDEEIVLVDKDSLTYVYDDEDVDNKKYSSYDTARFTFKLRVDSLGDPVWEDLDNYAKYYDISFESSTNTLFINKVDDLYVVHAVSYSDKVETVTFRLEPKNAAGAIRTIERTVKIRAVTKPTGVTVTRQGEIIPTEKLEQIKLYDVYSNGMGSNFKFEVSPSYTYEYMRGIRIEISPSLLNAQVVDGTGKSVGVNRVVNDGEVPSGVKLRDNAQVLGFLLNNMPMDFYYNTATARLQSKEIITPNQSVTINYTTIESDNSDRLTMSLQTICTSDKAYLKEVEMVSVGLVFNHEAGVKSVSINAGELTSSEFNAIRYSLAGDPKEVENVFINVNEKLTPDTRYALNIPNDKVLGVDGKALAGASFELEVTSHKGDHVDGGLKLKQNKSGAEASHNIKYEYNGSSSLDNAIIFEYADAKLGKYKIIITHASGYKRVINVELYEKLDDDSIRYTLTTDDKYAFKNKIAEHEYLYAGYEADYIVANNRNGDNALVLTIQEVNTYSDDYIKGYSYEARLLGGDVGVDYFKYDVSSNVVDLHFYKGTFIDGGPKSIVFDVAIDIRDFENILTEKSESMTVNLQISFYVYQIITEQDFADTDTTITKYANEFLGAYNVDKSIFDHEIEFKGGDDLWEYVLPAEQDDNIFALDPDGKEIDFDEKRRVVWVLSDATYSSNIMLSDQEDTGIKLKFTKNSMVSRYVCELYAIVSQFRDDVRLKFTITVETPILSEKLIVRKTLDEYNTDDYNNYINLRPNDTYNFAENEIECYSPLGIVTNPGMDMIVVNQSGNMVEKNVVDAAYNDTTHMYEIRVGSNIYNNKKLTLILLASDTLKQHINSTRTDLFNAIADGELFITPPGVPDSSQYSKAYVMIDIILSDGKADNPYLIRNAKEFWEIGKDAESKKAYYTLMTNIDLSGSERSLIDNFEGHISSYNDGTTQYNYTIHGLTLDKDYYNLFGTFRGEMYCVNLLVHYDINFDRIINADRIVSVGVFRENYGTLDNVTLNISGNIATGDYTSDNYYLKTGAIYFGGLVAENYGEIIFTKDVVGVSGNLTIQGPVKTYAGALVGVNRGGIISSSLVTAGVDSTYSLTQEVVFAYIADSGAVASVNIDASSLDHNDSTVGGVVGYNTYYTDGEGDVHLPKIYNVYVTGSIKGVNNIGGVIGCNESQTTTIKLLFDTGVYKDVTVSTSEGYADTIVTYDGEKHEVNIDAVVMSDAESTIRIEATGSNAGGLVGRDRYGRYVHNSYKILAHYDTGIQGIKNVGGLIGTAENSVLLYCYVSSYRWNYNRLTDIATSTNNADISGENHVAGIIGCVTGGSLGQTVDQGVPEGHQAVVIYNSSVNGCVKSIGEDVGGLYTSDFKIVSGMNTYYRTFVANAYFVGHISGNYTGIKMISNTADKTLGNDYAIKTYAVSGDKEYVSDPSFTYDKEITSSSIWQMTDVNINGGYAYLIYNGNPLVDIAPNTISAIATGSAGRGYKVDETHIHFDYYAFNLSLEDADYQEVQSWLERQNTYKITDVLSFSCTPNTIKQIRLLASSSDTRVVDISGNNLIVKGEGQAVLTFISVLNSAIKTQVFIDVAKPLGETLILSETSDDRGRNIEGSTLYITKNRTEQYFLIQDGELMPAVEKRLLTCDNIRFDIKITAESYQVAESFDPAAQYFIKIGDIFANQPGITNSNFSDQVLYVERKIEISDYIMVGGKSNPTTDNMMTIKLSDGDVISINIKENAEHTIFHFEVTPYKAIEFDGLSEYKIAADVIRFDMLTYSGAYDILLSHNSAILYPNDTTVVTAFVSTDVDLTDDMISDIIATVQIDDQIVTNSIAGIEYVGKEAFDAINQVQKLKYRVTFTNGTEMVKDKAVLRVYVQLKNGENSSVEFTVLAQRIDSIDIKNYLYTDIVNNTIQASSVLRSDLKGLIIINIAPDNAYYDYLEIRDITGTEEISYKQLDGINGNPLEYADEVLPDGKGIRLSKTDAGNIYYVETMIDRSYSSRRHLVQVTPCLDGGVVLGKSYTIDVDVRMLPSINATYVEPNGQQTTVIDIESAAADTMYLASGVEAEILVETRNSNGSFNYSLSYDKHSDDIVDLNIDMTGDFNVREYEDKIIIEFKDPDKNYDGKTLYVKFSTSVTIDKHNESSSVEIAFRIVDFVVHSVSVKPSVERQGVNTIYGNYDKDVDLEFYFAATDISYYESGTYWRTEYYYEAEPSYAPTDYIRDSINDILYELNFNKGYSSEQNEYIKLIKDEFDPGAYAVKADEAGDDVIILNGNRLTVKSHTQLVDLRVNMELYLHDGVWCTYENTSVGHQTVDEIKQVYDINFVTQNTLKDAVLIRTEEEFLAMESGDIYYILANDIVLGVKKPYSPITVDVSQFDGNGYTITISQLAPFEAGVINVGLFKEIPATMLVSNLTVEYDETAFGQVLTVNDNGSYKFNVKSYYDLCTNGINYTEAYFGGIAATNNGLITNCRVTGQVALDASYLHNGGGDKANPFYMGGLVATNTGYITHSTSELRMFALANMGGLVHKNSGKIASSSFCGAMYVYHAQKPEQIIANSAGFVVENSGTISMSYTDIGTTIIESVNSKISNINAKDPSAGFVYNNTGEIYDCYVDIELLRGGAFNATFAGFVHTNSNTINRCYTYVNNSNNCVLESTKISGFTTSETKGITNSYEIVDNYNAQTRVEGVEQILFANRANSRLYNEFNFGDNINSTWRATGSYPPILTANVNLVSAVETGAISYTYNGYKGTLYRGIKNIFEYEIEYYEEGGITPIKKVVREVLLGDYGSYNDPYLIYNVETWNKYLVDELPRYYRIISDIDFSKGKPVTRDKVMNGNFEGNNMLISNYLIHSSEALDSIGLFKTIEQSTNKAIASVVKNLQIKPYSISATGTEAVGSLAGIVQDAKIYNVSATSDQIVVGGKVVGGIIGLAKGAFDMEGLYSSVGVNSTRETSKYVYNVYTSSNNNLDNNLSNVSYAGAVIGILDAYDRVQFDQNDIRDIRQGYYSVRNVTVEGAITSIADSAGAVFGFVGERAHVTDIQATLTSGKLNGVQYTGGVAGENRGVISNAHVKVNQNSDKLVSPFYSGNAVSAGIVGFNAGGLVMNCSFNGYMEANKTPIQQSPIVAGIVGRSVNGTVTDCTVDGRIKGYITGGIIGASYTFNTLKNRISGLGAVSDNSLKAIPQSHVQYKDYEGNSISNLSNVKIKDGLLSYWMSDINSFYQYYIVSDKATHSYIQVLGLAVGLSDQDSVADRFGYDTNNKEFVINNDSFGPDAVGILNGATLNTNVYGDTPLTEVITAKTGLTQTYIMYLLGAKVTNFDYWLGRSYSNDIVVFTNEGDKLSSIALGTSADVKSFYINKVDATQDEVSYYEIDSSETVMAWNIAGIKSIFDDEDIVIHRIEGDIEDASESAGTLSVLEAHNDILRFDLDNTKMISIRFTGKVSGEVYDYITSFKLRS